MRIYDLLVEQFPEYDRDTLKAKLLAGAFKLDGETVYDPNRIISESSVVSETRKKYVSRGGLKLEAALDKWAIDVRGKVLLDAGSSTGGFTDCLLQRGAGLVHAVDVGYNQLDYTLRRDERVIVHERTNIMHCTEFDPVPAAALADLSFRSIATAAEHILDLTAEGWGIVLIKPQFEGPYQDDTFTGVVTDRNILRNTVREVCINLYDSGILVRDLCRSPIQGRKGNTEFFGYISSRFEQSGNFEGRLDLLLSEAGL